MAKNGLVEPFWRVMFGWVEGNFDWVELGGIGIARGFSRIDVRVSRETSPPYCPLLLENNNVLEYDPHYVKRTNVHGTNVQEHMY